MISPILRGDTLRSGDISRIYMVSRGTLENECQEGEKLQSGYVGNVSFPSSSLPSSLHTRGGDPLSLNQGCSQNMELSMVELGKPETNSIVDLGPGRLAGQMHLLCRPPQPFSFPVPL